MGLVRVLPAEGFAAAVQARAAEIANLSSPRSTRIIKRQVYEALFQSLAEATAIANREQEICRDTEDFREGVAHYLEKRSAEFQRPLTETIQNSNGRSQGRSNAASDGRESRRDRQQYRRPLRRLYPGHARRGGIEGRAPRRR